MLATKTFHLYNITKRSHNTLQTIALNVILNNTKYDYLKLNIYLALFYSM